AGGNPVSGATVDFAKTVGNGSVAPLSATTGVNGQASTTITLGTTAGTNTYTATVHATAITTNTSVTGTADGPAATVQVSTNNAATIVTTPLVDALPIDAGGNPVSGATVDFAKTAGNGSVAPLSATTDVTGQASTTLTLGSAAGTNT